jgi:hypothetical protein
MRNVRYRSGKPLENSKVRSAIADAESRLNGQGRLVVRPSGTEPVIRIMGEGDDKAMIEEVVDGIAEVVAAHAALKSRPAALVIPKKNPGSHVCDPGPKLKPRSQLRPR